MIDALGTRESSPPGASGAPVYWRIVVLCCFNDQLSWVGFIISVPFPQALSLQLHCKAASPPKRIGSRNVRIQDTTSDKPGGFWRGSVRRTNESHCAIFNVSFAKTSCNPTGHLSTISSPLRLKVLLIAVFSRTPSQVKVILQSAVLHTKPDHGTQLLRNDRVLWINLDSR